MAYETPLKIYNVIQDISANKYILPAIQREFIWNTSQIEQLFDSLMHGYPIGAFLFWELPKSSYKKYEFYSFLQNYHERDATHNPKTNPSTTDSVMAVLDGQQRLTSLYIGLKGTYAEKIPYRKWHSATAFPKRKLYLNIVKAAEEENVQYDFQFLTSEEVDADKNDSNYFWFEVGKILDMKELGDVTEFLLENITYSESPSYSKEQGKFANRTLSKLYNVIHEEAVISYYKETAEELDKVLNIFIRVNSGGTPLSYSDLLLSIASAQWSKYDAREEITDLVDGLNSIGGGFNVNKDFILKSALVLTDFRNVAFKVDNFNKANMQSIENNWKVIQKALYSAFNLVSSFGFNRDSLKSNNAVIPIAYYLKTIGLPNNFETSTAHAKNRKKIKKWLIMSLIKRIFSGQADNVLRVLRDVIARNEKNDFPLETIIDKLRGNTKTIVFTDDDIEMLLELKYGKGETLTALMLLYPSLDFNNKFHIDHIYPKSKFTENKLRRRGITSEQTAEYINCVNNIANLQLLEALPNIEKQDKDFDVWFEDNCPSDSDKYQYRKVHYLPNMEYTYPNFIEFIEKRRGLMKKKFKDLLLN